MNVPPPDSSDEPSPVGALRAMLDEGALDVRILNAPQSLFGDTYYRLLHETWGRLLLQFVVAFLAFNLAFAALYALDPHGLDIVSGNGEMSRFWRGFFFSVHTLVTIGYGNVAPATVYANIIVVIEAMTGVLGFAVTTGLVFARFARPTARVIFSRHAVVAPFDGVQSIMLRAVNQRHNLILEATARLSLLRAVKDDHGRMMRRFYDLDLVRARNPVFALSWTVVHPITPSSPFFGLSRDEIRASEDELIVVISGTDEGMAQVIHARTAYAAAALRWDARFADILGIADDGRRTIDYAQFDIIEPLPEP